MRIRQVEAFRAVVTSGGVTAAATLMNVSQPSVSRLIADLEREVGFALFARRGGRLNATQQGLALYEAVQRSFLGLDLLDQAARRIRAQPVGTIRVAALSALAAAILPPVLEAFARNYPAIKITVEAVGQKAVEDRVFLGQADIGLGVSAAPRDGVNAEPLVEAAYICAVPPGHGLASRAVVSPQDLEGETFIGPMHEADALWFGIDRMLTEHGVSVKRGLETQHAFTGWSFVAAGLGVMIAEPFSAPMFERFGVSVRPFAPRLSVGFALMEPDLGPTPPQIAEFRALVMQSAQRFAG